MSYIPKKLINPGLRATGNNFIDASTKNSYVGPYHENFNGKTFTNKIKWTFSETVPIYKLAISISIILAISFLFLFLVQKFAFLSLTMTVLT